MRITGSGGRRSERGRREAFVGEPVRQMGKTGWLLGGREPFNEDSISEGRRRITESEGGKSKRGRRGKNERGRRGAFDGQPPRRMGKPDGFQAGGSCSRTSR